MSQQGVEIASRGALHLADDLNVERGSCLAAKDASPNPPLHRKKALGEYLRYPSLVSVFATAVREHNQKGGGYQILEFHYTTLFHTTSFRHRLALLFRPLLDNRQNLIILFRHFLLRQAPLYPCLLHR